MGFFRSSKISAVIGVGCLCLSLFWGCGGEEESLPESAPPAPTDEELVVDPPHDDSDHNIQCASCHSNSAGDLLSPEDLSSNEVCLHCHAKNEMGSYVQTHSSQTTSPTHGQWQFRCIDCHNPHLQEQNQKYGTSYGKLIRTIINGSEVHFTGLSGKNSYADGDEVYDGVCEVCHTETKYYRKDGSLFNGQFSHGEDGKNCASCHRHDGGFAAPATIVSAAPGAECGNCHGTTTSSMTSGTHPIHFDEEKGPGISSCTTCHASEGESTHVDGKVDFRDGQQLAETTVCEGCHSVAGYEEGIGEAKEKWSHGEGVECGSCHSVEISQLNTGAHKAHFLEPYGPEIKDCYACHLKNDTGTHVDGKVMFKDSADLETTETCNSCHRLGEMDGVEEAKAHWPSSTEVSCGSCHSTDEKLPDKHSDHLSPDNEGLFAQSKATCETCHTFRNQSEHGNGVISFTDGMDKEGTGVCTSCHSTDGVYTEGIEIAKANWDVSSFEVTCGNCHIADPSIVNTPENWTGAHYAHFNEASGPEIGTCDTCHSPIENSKHLNRNMDFVDNQDFEGTEACQSCHSLGGVSGVQEAKTNWPMGQGVSCGSCHSVEKSDLTTGKHSSHLDSTLGRAIECGDCHTEYGASEHGDGGVDFADGREINETTTCNWCHSAGIAAYQEEIDGEDGIKGQWNNDNYDIGQCQDCHYSSGEDLNIPTGAHEFHLSNITLEGKISQCYDCHADTSNTEYHLDREISFKYEEESIVDLYSTDACDGCHGVEGDYDGTVEAKGSWSLPPENGLSCAGCHDTAQDKWDDVPREGRRAVYAEYASNASHAYFVQNEYLGEVVANEACYVCHQEQEHTTGHMNGNVALVDPDDEETTYQFITLGDFGEPTSWISVQSSGHIYSSGLVDETKNWIENQWAGFLVILTKSRSASYSRKILSNTSNQILWDKTIDSTGLPSYTEYSIVTSNLTGGEANLDVSNFCMNCHDADGATRLGSESSNPFRSGLNTENIKRKFQGTVRRVAITGDYAQRVDTHHDIATGSFSTNPDDPYCDKSTDSSCTDQIWSRGAVECINCHNAHAVTDTEKIIHPDDITEPMAYVEEDQIEFCIQCHDGSRPEVPNMPTVVLPPALLSVTNEEGEWDDVHGSGTVRNVGWHYGERYTAWSKLAENVSEDADFVTLDNASGFPDPETCAEPEPDVCDGRVFFINRSALFYEFTYETKEGNILEGFEEIEDETNGDDEDNYEKDKYIVEYFSNEAAEIGEGYESVPAITCSTCHDPHGSYYGDEDQNGDGKPDYGWDGNLYSFKDTIENYLDYTSHDNGAEWSAPHNGPDYFEQNPNRYPDWKRVDPEASAYNSEVRIDPQMIDNYTYGEPAHNLFNLCNACHSVTSGETNQSGELQPHHLNFGHPKQGDNCTQCHTSQASGGKDCIGCHSHQHNLFPSDGSAPRTGPRNF